MKTSLLPYLFSGVSAALSLGGNAAADTLSLLPRSIETTAHYSGTATVQHQAGAYFAEIEPFDASLGTLVSFTIQWEFAGSFDGLVQNEAESGFAVTNLGGTFSIGGIAFSGGGGSGEQATAVGGGSALTSSYTLPSFSNQLTAANAGVTYDPRILEAVTGSAPFRVEASNSAPGGSFVTVSYGSLETLQAAVNANITVTYQYTPKAGIPDPNLNVTGILREPSSGDVTLTWSSAPGTRYLIDATSNLSDWNVITVPIEATGPETEFSETGIPAGTARRFYRVRSQP